MPQRHLFVSFVLAVLVLVGAPLGAQQRIEVIRALDAAPAEPEASGEAAESADPAPAATRAPVFFLRDGSQVVGSPRLEALEVHTRYGVLQVPQDELFDVRLVRRVDAAIDRRVAKLVEELGSPDFNTREEAFAALEAIGPPALPRLQTATSSGDEEVQARAELLVETIESSLEEEEPEDAPERLEGEHDEVVTVRMTIRGRVEHPAFAVETRYGPLEIAAGDVQEIRFRRLGPSSASFDVLPSHQPPSSWLETDFTLEKGASFRIEATGTLNASRYGVSCGPAGTSRWRSSDTFGGFQMLALVGRVGEKGEPFLIGPSHEGKTKRKGELHLSIVPFRFDTDGVSGKFEVGVKVLRER